MKLLSNHFCSIINSAGMSITTCFTLTVPWAQARTNQLQDWYWRLRRIWSQTHLIPGLRIPNFLSPWTNNPLKIDPPGQRVLMEKWSPKVWSPWTNGPQPIWSPHFRIPTACPPIQMEYSSDHLSRGTKLVVDHLSIETRFPGTICPWEPNWLGTVCPKAMEFHSFGLSRGTNQLGTN